MLTTLRIKNLALVSDLTLEFKGGYTAITGETGAGKSILIGALNLILGERAERGLIRSGTENCAVEATFEISSLQSRITPFLAENGIEPCEGNSLVVKRAFTTGGLNRQFINGSSTTLSILSRLGEWLVDIHGPHEHQSLLYPRKQLAILDSFAKVQGEAGGFRTCLDRLLELRTQKEALIIDDQTLAQRLEHLRFQVSEIRQAALRDGEEEGLSLEYARVKNSARLRELSEGAQSALGEEEIGLLAKMPLIGRLLLDLKRLDPNATALFEAHSQLLELVTGLHRQISAYNERLDSDPEKLQALEERMDLLHALKRKYGKSVSEINSFAENAALELKGLEERDVLVSKIDDETVKVWNQASRLGAEISAKRKNASPRIAKATIHHLKTLGFAQSHFEVNLKTVVPPDSTSLTDRTGFDDCEFLFSPNTGEPLRPLRQIASSGEIARVMLALKTVLAAEDEVPVLIFDEVDANVGGETSRAVGEKMRQIGAKRQVLCITHLGPVAAMADHHFLVNKEVIDHRTLSSVRELEGVERVEEIARMLGGKTDAARRHAESLLNTEIS